MTNTNRKIKFILTQIHSCSVQFFFIAKL